MNVTRPGSKKPAKKSVKVDQKQMVYYSEKYAKKQKADRDAMIARANDLINHPKKYDRVTSKRSATYVKNIAFDKSTSEIIDDRNLELDTKKISEEEKYDGYELAVEVVRSLCEKEFVKKGMCVQYAIHDSVNKKTGQQKVDKQNRKQWKCKSVPTNDWNSKENAKLWRKAFVETINAVNERMNMTDDFWEWDGLPLMK